MEHMKAGVLSKVKSVISVIYGIFLWVTKLSSSPKSFQPHHHLQLGIGALIFSSVQNFFSSSSSLSSSLSSSSSSTSSSSSCFSWSSTMGDLIGTESGVYMSPNEEKLLGEVHETKPYANNINQRKRNKGIGTKREKNYPPPIHSLARTGYLTGRMPWILSRRYVNGRLILREERVNRYEYFEVHRENGRLRLNLIPLDDTIPCCCPVEEENEDSR
ncbi:uncharacterized protein LOC130758248 [Actinidia eriantha]|uniref:uncharacterized protein LOC130758248 n=1 Tax=Actinidia eriantha TaxID=165200 RepID=UPI0025858B00|nr:uncharacterized protein LOC130758248 [Actinidia eriantha]